MPQVPSSVTISGRTSPMVIGQICHGSTGGSSRMACRVANGLARRGHIVHLFSREPLAWQVDPRVSLHAFAPAATECRTPLYRDWVESDRAAFTSLLGAAIEVQPFDVLHYHYARPFAGLVGGLVDGLDAPPPAVVGTLHGTDLTDSLGDAGALSRLRCELADSDALTTVSRDMYRRCSAALPSAQARLRIVPNFIEDQLRTRTRTASVQPTILHVSNFRAVKDVGLLARLFVAVHERTGARLCLIGDGPELPKMRRFLDDSVASAAVRYAGVTAHPEDHFSQATVLLSTSVEESFGLVLLEAMAAGLPVVARAVGGVPELVDDGLNGMLFNDSDFTATVERIVALLRSEDRLAAMRRAGWVRADHLRESRVIGAYEALYRDALVARGLNGEGRIA